MFRIFFVSISAFFIFVLPSQGKDYNASLFGIRSDGVTLNTGSIQTAVNYISEQGGGRLMFYVGRYLTGTIELKSNVVIHLEEGAVLVGVPSIYDYYREGEFRPLLYGNNQTNISVTGKGVIMGNGRDLLESRTTQLDHDYIPNTLSSSPPGLIHFNNCDSVQLSGILMMNSGGDVIRMVQSSHIEMENLTIKNGSQPGNGIILEDSGSVVLIESYIETGGEELISSGSNHDVRIERTINEIGEQMGMH